MAADPQDPNTIYVGTWAWGPNNLVAHNSVWKSTDGGASWIRLRGPDTVGQLSDGPAIVIDPQSASTIYFGDNENWYKSADGGANWSEILPGCQGPGPYYADDPILVIDPQDSNRLYAGHNGGVCQSTDGGATWTAIGRASCRERVSECV